MVLIDKAEALAIRERFPNVHIVRTMKQKSKRHKYYCEENTRAMRLLHEMRGNPLPNDGKGERNNRSRKKKR